MSQYPNKEIAGDLSVSRNITSGGNLLVRGGARINSDLKVEGWLDAPNIKGPMKGLFSNEASLKKAYPHPQKGWWACVGTTFPCSIYMVSPKGEWEDSGDYYEGPNISLESVYDRIDDAVTKLTTTHQTDSEALTEKIADLKGLLVSSNSDLTESIGGLLEADENLRTADEDLQAEIDGLAKTVSNIGSKLTQVSLDLGHFIEDDAPRTYVTDEIYEAKMREIAGSLSNHEAKISAAARKLLIDMWDNATSSRISYSVGWNTDVGYGAGRVGRYNEETGFFELNGLNDISDSHALRILLSWMGSDCESQRTNLPIRGHDTSEIEVSDRLVNSGCEVWWGSPVSGTAPVWVVNNIVLREMRFVNLDSHCYKSVIKNVPALVTLECVRVEMTDINISGSPKLSMESIIGLCNKAPEGAVIRLHPSAYALAMADADVIHEVELNRVTLTTNA